MCEVYVRFKKGACHWAFYGKWKEAEAREHAARLINDPEFQAVRVEDAD